jgi:hypothetical protein
LLFVCRPNRRPGRHRGSRPHPEGSEPGAQQFPAPPGSRAHPLSAAGRLRPPARVAAQALSAAATLACPPLAIARAEVSVAGAPPLAAEVAREEVAAEEATLLDLFEFFVVVALKPLLRFCFFSRPPNKLW